MQGQFPSEPPDGGALAWRRAHEGQATMRARAIRYDAYLAAHILPRINHVLTHDADAPPYEGFTFSAGTRGLRQCHVGSSSLSLEWVSALYGALRRRTAYSGYAIFMIVGRRGTGFTSPSVSREEDLLRSLHHLEERLPELEVAVCITPR